MELKRRNILSRSEQVLMQLAYTITETLECKSIYVDQYGICRNIGTQPLFILANNGYEGGN